MLWPELSDKLPGFFPEICLGRVREFSCVLYAFLHPLRHNGLSSVSFSRDGHLMG
jgi:hypothetical protein